MTKKITIFWFRQDLRLSDNPGLFEAAQRGPVLPIYILDQDAGGEFKIGAASLLWLHHSLEALDQQLTHHLNLYVGNPREIILRLLAEYPIDAVYWNRSYEPWRIKEDTEIKTLLKERGIVCKSFNGSLLWEPWEILKNNGEPYKVFTPFYRKGCLHATEPRIPLAVPDPLHLVRDLKSCEIEDLQLIPMKPWFHSIESTWKIGEKAAHEQLENFMEQGLSGYQEQRNYPSKSNVSRLSPYLHYGEISPNQVWCRVYQESLNTVFTQDMDHFLSELGWREFAYYLLYHFPELPVKNFQSKFDQFPWCHDMALLKAWQRGQTGFPIIDAGMRELWQTGYMHNRVRMIVASFLVKNLGLHWHHGAKWFWDCLVDADLANNSASWQWVAGSGADAAPYFRIFNPITQGEKFDSDGTYTRRFVPELSELPKQFLFKPWDAPAHVLKNAGVIFGENYPEPIVDLKLSRERALQAYQSLSKI